MSGGVFLVVTAAHLARLVLGWELEIGGWYAPSRVSAVGLVFAVARASRES